MSSKTAILIAFIFMFLKNMLNAQFRKLSRQNSGLLNSYYVIAYSVKNHWTKWLRRVIL